MDEECWSDKEFGKAIKSYCSLAQTMAEIEALEFAKSDGLELVEDKDRPLVDAHDVVDALLLVYKKPEAKGRYICSSFKIRMKELVDKLKSLYPNYNYPKSFSEVDEDEKLSSEKLQNCDGSIGHYKRAFMILLRIMWNAVSCIKCSQPDFACKPHAHRFSGSGLRLEM